MTAAACGAVEYVLNALWQVPLVAGCAWLVAWVLRAMPVRVLHRVWVAALALEVSLPAVALRLTSPGQSGAGGNTGVYTSIAVAAVHGGLVLGAGMAKMLATAYALAVLLLGLRLVRSARLSLRLSKDACALHLAVWDELGAGLKGVRLLESAKVAGPLTVGVWKRVVLMPNGFAEAVGAEDVHAALVHELAHVARRDFAKGLLYHAWSLPLSFHPALRWTLANIAATRELVCDERAADALRSPEAYASSLLRLAIWYARKTRVIAVHAIGMFDANTLERRLTMLMERREKVRMLWARVLVVAGLAGCGCGTALALRVSLAVPLIEAAGAKVDAAMMAGQIKSKVMPVYPADVKEKKIEGAVVLATVIGEDGSVSSLKVLSGPAELQASAIEAVRQWVYTPYLLNGKATEVETTVTVTYSIGK